MSEELQTDAQKIAAIEKKWERWVHRVLWDDWATQTACKDIRFLVGKLRENPQIAPMTQRAPEEEGESLVQFLRRVRPYVNEMHLREEMDGWIGQLEEEEDHEGTKARRKTKSKNLVS